MEVDMYKLFAVLILWIFFIPNLYADNYIASRQELWFSDSSYYKTSHHIKIGKSVVFNNYNLRCNTVIQLTNEISQFDRIFKLYVLNFREYFKINVLKTTC